MMSIEPQQQNNRLKNFFVRFQIERRERLCLTSAITGPPSVCCILLETGNSVLQEVTYSNPKSRESPAKFGRTAIFGIDTHGLPPSSKPLDHDVPTVPVFGYRW